jgi:hypothetical protein
MTLTPAYGRDYKSKKEVLADLESGKDFFANDYNKEGYINLAQMKSGQSVQIRYQRLTKVMTYTKP